MFYIYKITNLINNKIYIGLTTGTISGRWSSHKSRSKNAISGIDAAIRKYGAENFKVEQWDTANTLEELNLKEQFWIKELNCRDNSIGYNQNDGGDGNIGYHHTEYDKYRCGSSFRGKSRVKTPEQIEKWRSSFVGHKFSDDVKKDRSIKLKLAYAEGRRRPNAKGVGGRGKMTESEKIYNSENQIGKKWMNNKDLQVNLVVWKNELELFKSLGWCFGKIKEYKTLSRKDAKVMNIL